ncbi:malonyl CoA-acyl carrier protein transacylase [Microtetraspora sp. NBRC 13810]|uniref:malonate decarboxylase subunit epsilon n=1 Tax=Microtetraspora sp. NBRC 13810 TaxID=3030990 RepID=UPI0024A422D3|nr:malonate decarboxylase subunit epsilon [Microtetraspora sp. NBRC 13810]GLW11302.1 malonyl CoA-acyl carrier protein transacylase [Microtetraspora sp. NBRC 13810]
MRVAFLYPGQGTQRPGMLHDLPDQPAVAATLAEAERILPGSSGNDTAQALRSTVTAQVALCVAGVAATRALAGAGVTPDAVAGHSVGAFPAAVAAGALTFAEALTTVRRRGELMRDAYPRGYGMAAVLGLTVSRVRRMVESIGTDDDPAYVAVVDTDQQIVVAGSTRALERLAVTAARDGARRVQRLDIGVPSHCPLLGGVADALADLLGTVPRRRLTVPYVGDSTGRLLRDTGAVLDDLARGVATTVRWRDATALLGELGTTLFIQAPPGHVLARMAGAAHPHARVLALAETGVADAAVRARRAREHPDPPSNSRSVRRPATPGERR